MFEVTLVEFLDFARLGMKDNRRRELLIEIPALVGIVD